MTEHKCQGRVFDMYQTHDCGKKAGYEHEGRWFCKTHHLPTIIEKRMVRNAQLTAEFVAKAARDKEARDSQIEMKRKAAMFDELLEALKSAAEALEIASTGGGVDFYAYAKTARAAIAKAEQA